MSGRSEGVKEWRSGDINVKTGINGKTFCAEQMRIPICRGHYCVSLADDPLRK